MKEPNNFNKYWRNWRVLQTPKIDFDKMHEDGWEVYDVNLKENSTIAKKDNITIRADYSYTGGVNKLTVTKEGNKVYEQLFNFLLKPTVPEIQKVLECAGVSNWRTYYTAN